ncbi:Ig-like domain-containing protein [Geothrix sp. SG200]|uniref:Ig-like domain-containing protein n=1 Tax=Geothrix sp. SG200 TaxID=2922865 RepID=UPI001FAE2816|nr:Ig-like domain-containing protein [Geothrix sp. SG200]
MTTQHFRGVLALLVTTALALTVDCGGTTKPNTSSAYLSVDPVTQTLYPGQATQLRVTLHAPDGSSSQVSSGVSFRASADGVATVSASGIVTGVAIGIGTVTATLDGKSADAVVKVTPLFPGPVFIDDYASGVAFAPFGGSTNSLSVDPLEHHSWATSLKVAVPASGYTGGTLKVASPQNMSLYNAVTFWAKASTPTSLAVAGFGDDAAGDVRFKAELSGLPLSTEWAKFVLPIPAPAKLSGNTALFHFAQGSSGSAYAIWFDDIQYEALPASELGAPTAAAVGWTPINIDLGRTAKLPSGNGSGNTATFTLPSVTLTNLGIGYFDLTSSNPGIALPGTDGTVKGLAFGTAQLTATLGGVPAGVGTVTVAPATPTTLPPAPTLPASSVISLLTKVYPNSPVDTWSASWGVVGGHSEMVIVGQTMQKYANLGYAGIEFTNHQVDASQMGYFHVDIWTPDMSAFHVKLVDFGADGIYSPSVDDTAFEITVPVTALKQWQSIDLPLSSFTGMNFRNQAQIVIVGEPYQAGTVFLTNVYYHK